MVDLTRFLNGQINDEIHRHGLTGSLLYRTNVDVDGHGGLDLACLVKTPENRINTVFVIDNGNGIEVKPYDETRTASSRWDDRRFQKILSRLFDLFPHINTQQFTVSPEKSPRVQATISAQREKSLWGRAWSAVKNFVLPPQHDDFYDDQLTILNDIRNINDPRFVDVLMGIAYYDLKIGDPEFYDIYVLEAVDRVIASLVPSLDMDQLIKLKRQTDIRLENVRAYWRKHQKDKGLEKFAKSHVKRLEKIRGSAQTQIAGRLRKGSTARFSADSRYGSAHYQSAVSELARTPVRVTRGFDHLLRNSNPVNVVPRFVVGAAHSIWRGVTDIPFELGGIATAGAYGLYGGELGGSVANTALIAVPVVKIARGLSATRLVETGAGGPIKFVDLTESSAGAETAPMSPGFVTTPLGQVKLPAGGFFASSRNPATVDAGGGLATYSEAGPGTWIMPLETPRTAGVPTGWSFQTPPRVMTRARNLTDETPLIFPGVAATVMREPEPTKNEFIVLPGAESRTDTIGDPTGDQQQIGDLPPREDEEMFAGRKKTKEKRPVVGMYRQIVEAPLEEIMDAQLTLQVEVSFDAHSGFLERNGLGPGQNVLDVGTGNGDFCCRLAQLNPSIRFVGLDLKADMIQKAQDRAAKSGLSNITWLEGDVSGDVFGGQTDLFDGILLRYTDVHIPDFERVLPQLYRLLKPGGRLWIITLELDNMYSTPQNEVFDLYKEATQRTYDKFGIDGHRGSSLPAMLQRNGFHLNVSETDPMSSEDMGISTYQRYLLHEARFIHTYAPENLSEVDLRRVGTFVETVVPQPGFYGAYGVVMMAAEKP